METTPSDMLMLKLMLELAGAVCCLHFNKITQRMAIFIHLYTQKGTAIFFVMLLSLLFVRAHFEINLALYHFKKDILPEV